jgi:hypothetical protein
MVKNSIVTSMKMDSDFHKLLRTLAAVEKRSLSSLMRNLMVEALKERKKCSLLPRWISEGEFIMLDEFKE